jgi:hypothetical protein
VQGHDLLLQLHIPHCNRALAAAANQQHTHVRVMQQAASAVLLLLAGTTEQPSMQCNRCEHFQ